MMKEFFQSHIDNHFSHAVLGGTIFGTALGAELHNILQTAVLAIVAAVSSYITSIAIAEVNKFFKIKKEQKQSEK
jgi:hypothetical protein